MHNFCKVLSKLSYLELCKFHLHINTIVISNYLLEKKTGYSLFIVLDLMRESIQIVCFFISPISDVRKINVKSNKKTIVMNLYKNL